MPVTENDYPRSDHKWVRALRFLNVLDDKTNKLSPVKINLWASNLGAISTAVATILSFFGTHLTGVENAWGGVVAWLAASHGAHQFDKRRKRDDPPGT